MRSQPQLINDKYIMKLKIVVLSNGLNKYLSQLHNFCLLFGIRKRTSNQKLKTLIKFSTLWTQEAEKFFEDLCPRLLETFDIRSSLILTLCVENIISELRSCTKDMPLQLEFDRRFLRAVRRRLKRQYNVLVHSTISPMQHYTINK